MKTWQAHRVMGLGIGIAAGGIIMIPVVATLGNWPAFAISAALGGALVAIAAFKIKPEAA